MEAYLSGTGRLPAAFLKPGSSSFLEFLSDHQPELLPGRRSLPVGAQPLEAPHGTTIVAATFDGGVVLAGDRRATMGNIIAQRDIEKVFPADEYSAVGIAGTAGLAVEMVRLFQLELEHYEKIEGTSLSLEGKANRLTTMIRGNLGMAMQGLAVVPMFAGYDLEQGRGRVLSVRSGNVYPSGIRHPKIVKSMLPLWNTAVISKSRPAVRMQLRSVDTYMSVLGSSLRTPARDIKRIARLLCVEFLPSGIDARVSALLRNLLFPFWARLASFRTNS